MLQCGPLDSFIAYGTGWHAHAHLAILFLWNFIPTKNIVGDGLCICWSSSVRESRTSHYGSSGLKESWQCQWGVSKTMVHCWIVDSTIRVHSNSLKPVLTEENKMAWLFMALDSWDPQDLAKFLNMMD